MICVFHYMPVCCATVPVCAGLWDWHLNRSPCEHTCQRMPWGPPWWRSGSLQGRGPWPQPESLLLTRRKLGVFLFQSLLIPDNDWSYLTYSYPIFLSYFTFLIYTHILQWDAGRLVGENHAGSRVGGVHPKLLSHATVP